MMFTTTGTPNCLLSTSARPRDNLSCGFAQRRYLRRFTRVIPIVDIAIAGFMWAAKYRGKHLTDAEQSADGNDCGKRDDKTQRAG
jgi:hypothetical protein